MHARKKQCIAEVAQRVPELGEMALFDCARLAAELDSEKLGKCLASVDPAHAGRVLTSMVSALSELGDQEIAELDCCDSSFIRAACKIARGVPSDDPRCLNGDSVVCFLSEHSPPAYVQVRDLSQNVCDLVMEYHRLEACEYEGWEGSDPEDYTISCGPGEELNWTMRTALSRVSSKMARRVPREDGDYSNATKTAERSLLKELWLMPGVSPYVAMCRNKRGQVLRGGIMRAPVLTIWITGVGTTSAIC